MNTPLICDASGTWASEGFGAMCGKFAICESWSSFQDIRMSARNFVKFVEVPEGHNTIAETLSYYLSFDTFTEKGIIPKKCVQPCWGDNGAVVSQQNKRVDPRLVRFAEYHQRKLWKDQIIPEHQWKYREKLIMVLADMMSKPRQYHIQLTENTILIPPQFYGKHNIKETIKFQRIRVKPNHLIKIFNQQLDLWNSIGPATELVFPFLRKTRVLKPQACLNHHVNLI